jgi:hypothetical protein
MSVRFVARGLVGILLTACGDDGVSDSVQACRDLADVVARAVLRCASGSYQATYDAFVDAAANGDCENIIALRDRATLYDECIPSLDVIACTDLTAGNLDASCKGQLLHR